MTTNERPRAATLAVGTEVVDGQIIDRNSAWISDRLARAGIQVIEHRAVADDRDDIRRALRELSARANLIFVTGGLGPTSDDFTRELLAEHCESSLEFDPSSWKHVEDLLSSRGIRAREIQRQQCYFPKVARVLLNPAGTANAFSFDHLGIRFYALPGPPSEIAAVWEENLNTEIESLIPHDLRETLTIFRCLGRGESDIAELTEDALKGSDLRVGYRAHLPYIEVKIWYRERASADLVLKRVEAALKPWIVNRDDDDAADLVTDLLQRGGDFEIQDAATGGLLAERLFARARQVQTGVMNAESWRLTISTHWKVGSPVPKPTSTNYMILTTNAAQTAWVLDWKIAGRTGSLEVLPAFNSKLLSERGRRFITEKALLAPTVPSRFPHSGRFEFAGQNLDASEVLKLLAPYLTAERQERIRIAAQNRTCDLVPVLENIYDRGNISAVLRTAEAMGFQCAHVIELSERFKSANRVTQGADKWLDVERWKSTRDCTRELKRRGYQILATHLDARARPIGEMDFTRPTAIVFGNEKDGISPEMIEEADQTVIIPMQGFVQSYNISVAAALSLYHASLARGGSGNLTAREQEILRAEFSLRSSKNPARLIEEGLSRQSPKD